MILTYPARHLPTDLADLADTSGYNGHVFWDSETWMYPALLPLWPSIADGGVLQYRLNKLPGAKAKAKSYNKGWKGAMYPWERYAFSRTPIDTK